MRIYSILTAGILVGFSMLYGGVAAQSEFGPVTGNAENGKQLYFEHACYACHGYSGIGRRNLANDVSGVMVSEDVFLVYLRARADQNPEVPTQSMPSYSEATIPDSGATDIYAYIRTFRDEPPEVGEIPALESILEAAESKNSR